MSLWQPLRNLWNKRRNTLTARQPHQRRTAQPRIEGLEERLVLDRFAVTSTTGDPWSKVVKLESYYPGRSTPGECSGAMISSFHVLTAAHCVFKGQRGEDAHPTSPDWANQVLVYPGQNGVSNRPFGRATHSKLTILTSYRKSDLRDDFALISLHQPVGHRTGWFQFEYDKLPSWYRGTVLNSAGYPEELRSGDYMYRTSGPATDAYADWIRFPIGGRFEASPGQSGSGVWAYYSSTNRNLLHGVNSGHGDGYQWITRINEGRYNLLQRWMNADRAGGQCQDRCFGGGGGGGEPHARPDLTDADQWLGTSSAGFSASTVRPGENFRVNAGVYNLGMAAAGSFVVSFYAQTGTSSSSTRYLIGQATVSSLGSLSQTTATWNGTLPSIPAGHYYLGWAIDSGNSQVEYDESNNDGVLTRMQFSVVQANRAPIATDDAYTLYWSTSLSVGAAGVLGNDRDPDGHALRAALVSWPSWGTLTLRSDGSFTYVPRSSFSGTDHFTYRATDGALSSAPATVTIRVRPIRQDAGLPRVVAGDGQVFGLADDNRLWVYSDASQTWHDTQGYGKHIVVVNTGNGNSADDRVYLLASDNRVWTYTRSSGWVNTWGILKSLAAGDGQVFGLAFDDRLWSHSLAGGWTDLQGFGKELVLTNLGNAISWDDRVYLIAGDNRLWTRTVFEGWIDTYGYLKSLVAGDGQIFGLAADNRLWSHSLGRGWIDLQGFGKEIVVSNVGNSTGADDRVYLIAGDNRLWTRTVSEGWVDTRGYVRSLVAGDGQIFALAGDNRLWNYTVSGGWTDTGRHGHNLVVGNRGDSNSNNDRVYLEGLDGVLQSYNRSTGWTNTYGILFF